VRVNEGERKASRIQEPDNGVAATESPSNSFFSPGSKIDEEDH
jgi:hypothetical protein